MVIGQTISVVHASVFVFSSLQDHSVEKVVILFVTPKVKQLRVFFCIRGATGFLLAFFVLVWPGLNTQVKLINKLFNHLLI